MSDFTKITVNICIQVHIQIPSSKKGAPSDCLRANSFFLNTFNYFQITFKCNYLQMSQITLLPFNSLFSRVHFISKNKKIVAKLTSII